MSKDMKLVILLQWDSADDERPHRTFTCAWRHFLWSSWGRRVPLSHSGWRPGMRLSVLRSPRQPPTAKNSPSPNVESTETEKPCLKLASFFVGFFFFYFSFMEILFILDLQKLYPHLKYAISFLLSQVCPIFQWNDFSVSPVTVTLLLPYI